MTHKLYEAIGLSKGASKDDIKKAYKKLAVQYHPDKGGDPEKFKDISNAYSILSDDDKRAHYDAVGDEGWANGAGNGQNGFDMNTAQNIFEHMFGGGGGGAGFPFEFAFGGGHGGRARSGPAKCPDRHHVMRMSLRDAYFGFKKNLKVTVQSPCKECMENCNTCQGMGKITDMHRMGVFTQMMTRSCPTCQGKGLVSKNRPDCKTCQGNINVTKEHILDLNIPPGVETGHQMRFPGLGEQALRDNEVNGDLIIELLVAPDTVFQRHGNDLEMECPISFADSILGKTIQVPHFKEPFDIHTSTFGILQADKRYVVQGKGMKERSNLYIKFKIQYPERCLNAEERKKLRSAFESVGLI